MKRYLVFTDGSDFKATSKRLGVGGILVNLDQGGKFGKNIGEFSEELNRTDILRTYGTDQCSNPFAEMVATYYGLQKFSAVFKPGDHIVFFSDYEGVQKWLSGEWKAKLPYIIQIRDEILDILGRSPWAVEFKWVKGHQTSILSPEAYWNSEVDKLAKGIYDTTRFIRRK